MTARTGWMAVAVLAVALGATARMTGAQQQPPQPPVIVVPTPSDPPPVVRPTPKPPRMGLALGGGTAVVAGNFSTSGHAAVRGVRHFGNRDRLSGGRVGTR